MLQKIDRPALLNKLQGFCNAAASAQQTLGLLVIDLLEFRRVNAVYGYPIGDKVLAESYQRLEKSGFKGAELAHIGNDEFAIMLPGVRDPKLLSLAANKVVRLLSEPFSFPECTLRLEPVIGIAAQSGSELDAERLLVDAEKNLADARSQRKRFLPYSGPETRRHFDWQFESQLQEAVVNNELALFYQPKIDLNSRLPSQAEALARWPHPELGYISPIEFIPILEKTGAITDLTKWALHTVLREMQEWPLAQPDKPYSVAVNVSSSVLEDPEFPDVVKSALNIWSIDPQLLTLEITEGALVQEEHSSYRSIYQLKDLGLKISIDDFGTGYSCLSYFKRIPADELKIDQSFVTNLNQDKDDEHLTRTIIDLAHRFNMSVVAEGVEDEQTYLRLREFGCDYVQGFFFSKPLPHDRYCDWLKGFDIGNFFS